MSFIVVEFKGEVKDFEDLKVKVLEQLEKEVKPSFDKLETAKAEQSRAEQSRANTELDTLKAKKEELQKKLTETQKFNKNLKKQIKPCCYLETELYEINKKISELNEIREQEQMKNKEKGE